MDKPFPLDVISDNEYEYAKLNKLRPRSFYFHKPKHRPVVFHFLEARFIFVSKILGIDTNYFGFRHRLPLQVKRSFDIAFLLHYTRDHMTNRIPPSLLERWRFRLLWHSGYWKEINGSYISFLQKKKRTKRQQQFLDLYDDLHHMYYIELKNGGGLELFHARPNED